MSHETPKPGSIGTGLDLLDMLDPREAGQVLREGTRLTLEEQRTVAIQKFRQIGLDHRRNIISTEVRDERVEEVMQGLPEKAQDYFRGQVKGKEMTNFMAILKGEEINDLKPKSKKKDPGELEKSKHKGKHKWKQKHRDTSYIRSLMTKSQ